MRLACLEIVQLARSATSRYKASAFVRVPFSDSCHGRQGIGTISIVRALPAGSHSRHPGLEELRAMAAILVVGLHSGVPYLRTPMIALAWPTHDPHPSPLVDAFYWCIECFIMPLFFVLSGWSAATLCERKLGWDFLADRTRRILVPLVVSMFLILPMVMFVWATGWIAFLDYPTQKYFSFAFEGDIRGNLWGLAHLWYLEYLYIYCVILAAGSWFLTRYLRKRSMASIGQSARLPFVLFPAAMTVAGAVLLTWDNRIVLGFHQTFHPVLSKLLYYAIYFFAGFTLKSLPQLQAVVRQLSGSFCLVAIGTFALLLPLIHARPTPGSAGFDRLLLGVCLAVFGVSTTLAIFGTFLKRERPARPWVLWVAQASLWTYVMHLPAVGLVQIDLAGWQGPTPVKYALVWSLAVLWTLLTYEGLVRKSWLGWLLHGERRAGQRDFSMATLRAMFTTSRSKAA